MGPLVMTLSGAIVRAPQPSPHTPHLVGQGPRLGFPAHSGISRALSQGRIYFKPQSFSERGGNHRVQTPFQVKQEVINLPSEQTERKINVLEGGKRFHLN